MEVVDYSYQLRAMVVDDDSVGRHLLFRLLKQHSIQVIEACQYEIAIRGFITLNPGLIFLDQHLKGLNGLEIAYFIRRLTGGAYAKIYLHTTVNQQDLVDDPNFQYINGYIKKGDIDKLHAVIRAYLNTSTPAV